MLLSNTALSVSSTAQRLVCTLRCVWRNLLKRVCIRPSDRTQRSQKDRQNRETCNPQTGIARTDDCRSRSVQSAPSRQSESTPADNASLGRGGRYTLNVNALDDSPVLVSYDKHGFLVLTPYRLAIPRDSKHDPSGQPPSPESHATSDERGRNCTKQNTESLPLSDSPVSSNKHSSTE